MSMQAIGSAVLNLPIISHVSSLIGRSYRVIRKDQVAAQEAISIGILSLTGVIFTSAVKSAMMASSGRFSALGLGLYALGGLGIGTAVSGFLIYSFFSNLKKRENI